MSDIADILGKKGIARDDKARASVDGLAEKL